MNQIKTGIMDVPADADMFVHACIHTERIQQTCDSRPISLLRCLGMLGRLS